VIVGNKSVSLVDFNLFISKTIVLFEIIFIFHVFKHYFSSSFVWNFPNDVRPLSHQQPYKNYISLILKLCGGGIGVFRICNKKEKFFVAFLKHDSLGSESVGRFGRQRQRRVF
jgi:hypothetical protein